MNKDNVKTPNFLTVCFEDNVSTLITLFIIMFSVFVFINPSFVRLSNLRSIAFQFSELGLFSIAMFIAIVPGGIDLSTVATANLSSILMAFFIKNVSGASSPHIFFIILLTICIGLLSGFVCGALNGVLIGYLKIPAILSTLVTMTIFNGFSIGITKGATIASIPKEFISIGSGVIFGVPVPLIIFLFVSAVIQILLTRHEFGWNLFLIGTNPTASTLTGINIKRNILFSHMIIGIISSIAGIVILARTNSASAQYGNSYILSSILVVILGGVNILGGRGFFIGVVVAVVFLQVLSTGFNLILQSVSGSNFLKDFIWGGLLILMIFINKNGTQKAWLNDLFGFISRKKNK